MRVSFHLKFIVKYFPVAVLRVFYMGYQKSIKLIFPQNSSLDQFFLHLTPSPCYKLAKYLVPILSTACKNIYTIDNSYSFVSEISRFNNVNNYFMASFDMDNLFTNIPLSETIDIV